MKLPIIARSCVAMSPRRIAIIARVIETSEITEKTWIGPMLPLLLLIQKLSMAVMIISIAHTRPAILWRNVPLGVKKT